MSINEIKSDITRTTLAVLFIGVLIGASAWILRPFLSATLWATAIVVASWPLMLKVQQRLYKRRAAAVVVMTSLVLLVLVIPLSLAVSTLISHADEIVVWGKNLSGSSLPPMPVWLAELPLIGPRLAQVWSDLAAAGASDLVPRAAPYAGAVAKWFAAEVGSFGLLLAQFLLTAAIAAIMYANGEVAAAGILRFSRRLAGDHGEQTVRLAAQAVRAVAMGVGVTALVQSLLGGIGLALSGIPFAGLLTAIMFMLCIAQLGPALILAPAVIWLFWGDQTAWGSFLLVWTLVVGSLDNFLRPMLIRRGADLPLLLILAGVIGGLFAFGLIGIFVGPVILAVAYTLIGAWVNNTTD